MDEYVMKAPQWISDLLWDMDNEMLDAIIRECQEVKEFNENG